MWWCACAMICRMSVVIKKGSYMKRLLWYVRMGGKWLELVSSCCCWHMGCEWINEGGWWGGATAGGVVSQDRWGIPWNRWYDRSFRHFAGWICNRKRGAALVDWHLDIVRRSMIMHFDEIRLLWYRHTYKSPWYICCQFLILGCCWWLVAASGTLPWQRYTTTAAAATDLLYTILAYIKGSIWCMKYLLLCWCHWIIHWGSILWVRFTLNDGVV